MNRDSMIKIRKVCNRALGNPRRIQVLLGGLLIINPFYWQSNGTFGPGPGVWIGVGMLIASVIGFLGRPQNETHD